MQDVKTTTTVLARDDFYAEPTVIELEVTTRQRVCYIFDGEPDVIYEFSHVYDEHNGELLEQTGVDGFAHWFNQRKNGKQRPPLDMDLIGWVEDITEFKVLTTLHDAVIPEGFHDV